MSRYIDADALTWLVEEYKLAISPITEDQEHDNRLPLQMLTEFENMVAEQPTVDAVPVVHGEWKQHKKGGIYCSACKHDNHCGDVRLIMGYVKKFPICPWCGAKMDGKEKTDADS